MPEGSRGPEIPQSASTPETSTVSPKVGVETPGAQLPQGLPDVTHHPLGFRLSTGGIESVIKPSVPTSEVLGYSERTGKPVYGIAGGSDDPPRPESGEESQGPSRRDQLRARRRFVPRGQRPSTSAASQGPVETRPRSERRRREVQQPSFSNLNLERAQILLRMDAAGNLSPEDQVRITQIDQEMMGLETESRILANNFTVDRNRLLDPDQRLRVLQEAQLRQQDLPARYRGALTHYIDTEIRAQEQARLAVDILAIPENLSGSEFQQAQQLLEYYTQINPAGLSTLDQQRLAQERARRGAEIVRLVDEADQAEVLVDVRKRLVKFYKEVMESRHKDKYGRDRQQVIDMARQGYAETFWNNNPQLKQLEGRFQGVATYIWDGVVREVDKETNSEQSPPLNPVAESEFSRVKEQRAVDRRTEKKYMVYESSFYGRTWELTAETPEELIPAAQDFVRDRIAEIQVSGTDVGTINEAIQEIRKRGVSLLENNRVRLEIDTGQELPETNPYYMRAIALAEAVADVVGNEKVLMKGGDELGPQYKERFASGFIGHHDAIYLENPRAAYIMHMLTKYRSGTYWQGQPNDSEKYSEGQMADYRREIEGEIVDDAANHDFFITEEAFRQRNNGGHSFDDNIERLLLDPGNQIRNTIAGGGDSEALARHDLRVGVFKTIQDRLDVQERIVYNTPEERNAVIRRRIEQTMRGKGSRGYLREKTTEDLTKLAEARRTGNTVAADRILWSWVESYNQYNIRYRLPRWYPSGWDRVRMRIDRPTKLIDRGFSDEQFEAMFEPIQLPQDPREKERVVNQNINDSRFGFQLARSYQIFHMQDALLGGMRTRLADINTGQYTGRLMDDETSLLLGMIRERINPRTDQAERGRDGKIIYDVVDPNRKIVRIFDIVQARLEAAISREAADLDQAKQAKERAEVSGNQTEINRTAEILRDKMINAQFLPTHALKAIGLVDGKLPVWSYNFLDETTLDVFMKAMADYGVEAAGAIINGKNRSIPISHNQKPEFYELVERGRRALKSEYDRVAQEHMASSYAVYMRDENGNIVLDENGNQVRSKSIWRPSSGGEPGIMSERYRMINSGAVREDRTLVDARFEISTSGGVAVTELIPTLGDIGFYPLLVWMAQTDIKGLHGYIHRRDEVEFHHQKYFDVMDPVQHAKSTGAGYAARRSLTGGKIGDKSTPGLLKEPFHGGFKAADWQQKHFVEARSQHMDATANYIATIQQYRAAGMSYSQFLADWKGKINGTKDGQEIVNMPAVGKQLETWRQMSYLDLGHLDKPSQSDFYLTMYGVLDYFQWYLQATRDVEANRRGRAPRNWEYDNTLRWYEFRKAMRASMTRPDPEKGFILRLGYSPEVASELSIAMMEVVLSDADYLILRDFERNKLALDGAEILSKALTEDERSRGFELTPGGHRTLRIPDEKSWNSLRPEIKTALETIRRRGLMDFMREEGYSIYEVEVDPRNGVKRLKKDTADKFIPTADVLGNKIPPLVQESMRSGSNN